MKKLHLATLVYNYFKHFITKNRKKRQPWLSFFSVILFGEVGHFYCPKSASASFSSRSIISRSPSPLSFIPHRCRMP